MSILYNFKKVRKKLKMDLVMYEKTIKKNDFYAEIFA